MNPQAFPQNTVYQTTNGQTVQQGPVGGMSLRDYFAAKVLQGLWALPSSFENDEMTFEMCAETAYKQADAMLAERNKP